MNLQCIEDMEAGIMLVFNRTDHALECILAFDGLIWGTKGVTSVQDYGEIRQPTRAFFGRYPFQNTAY